MKNIIFIVLLITAEFCFSQQNPLYLDNLPKSTKFEFMSETDLNVSNGNKSEFYLAKIDSSSSVFYIITQGLPDCSVVSNQFDGFDIYEKLKIEGFQRIVHIRKAGEIFKVYYVNNQNENEKLVVSTSISDGHDDLSTLKIAYTFYWNNLLKN